MQKLYLHMGFHKTATTSFQETCKQNIDKLLIQGFVYPVFNSEHIKAGNIVNHSVPIYSLFCEEAQMYHVNVSLGVTDINSLHKDYTKLLKIAFSKSKDVILSGEDISMLDIRALEKLKNFVEEQDFEIIPLIVVRSPYEFSCSMKQEDIKSGKYCASDFYTGRRQEIENIKTVFPNAKFYPFKEICAHKNGTSAFLFEEMGVDYSEIELLYANVGMPNIVTRVLNILNKDLQKWEKKEQKVDFRTVATWLQATTYTNKETNRKSSQKYLLTQKEYESIESRCKDENDYFKKHLGENFCDKKYNFLEEDENLALFEQAISGLESQNLSPQEAIARYTYFIHKFFNKKK